MKHLKDQAITKISVINPNPGPDDLHAFVKQLLHDLRSPLGVIMLNASWISSLSDEQTPAPMKEANKMFLEQARCMRDLIDKADRIFDLQANRVDLKAAYFDLLDFTGQVISDNKPNRIRDIELTSSAGEYYVTTDPFRFQEILHYLFEFFEMNDQDYSPIHVHISARDQTEVCITISDSAMSIPEEKLADVFTPFNHIQLTKDSANRGSGLGPYLAYALIQDYLQGTLTIESNPMTGTTFEMILPANLSDEP